MAHTDKVIIWERADGGVSVTYLDDRDMLQGETEDAFITRMADKHGAAPLLSGAVRTTLSSQEVPADRTHQDCWKVTGGKVQVDAAKLQAKLDAKAAKQAKQDAVLSKLKISTAELKDLLERA